MGVEDFIHRFEAGDLDEGDAAVSELAVLRRIGQNGHRIRGA